MPSQEHIREKLASFLAAAPAGYAIAFDIQYTTPTFLFQSYPKAWLDYYSQNGLLLRDPTVAWGFENLGSTRWSDLAALDIAGVMPLAADHGMRFGATCAIDIDGARTIASFARSDREFSIAEMAQLLTDLEMLHTDLAALNSLSKQTADALRDMAVKVTHPAHS